MQKVRNYVCGFSHSGCVYVREVLSLWPCRGSTATHVTKLRIFSWKRTGACCEILCNPVTYWPSTFFKIKLRLVAVDLGQVTGFGFGSHVGMGLRSNSGLVVSRTPSATTTNTARLESRGLSWSWRLYTRPSTKYSKRYFALGECQPHNSKGVTMTDLVIP